MASSLLDRRVDGHELASASRFLRILNALHHRLLLGVDGPTIEDEVSGKGSVLQNGISERVRVRIVFRVL